MINLITGLPGNGKTLYAIWYMLKYIKSENARAEKEGLPLREVFYAGINDLTLPWTKIEPDKWHECPQGAIIIIDECQTTFAKLPNAAKPPEHYAALALHRHKGHDLFLITQHPMFVDTFLRKLVAKHIHMVRKWGTQGSTVHEWAQVRENCEKPPARKDSIKTGWAFPKEVFQYYKSAEVHTVRRNIPKHYYILALCVVALVVFGYWFYARTQAKIKGTNAPDAAMVAPGQGGNFGGGGGNKSVPFDPVADAKQYVGVHTPRFIGLPHTAPVYDEIRKPTEAPLPVGCVQSASRCNCFTQQATKMDVPKDICQQIVANGYFDDARRKEEGGIAAAESPHSMPLIPAGAVPVSAVKNERVVVLEKDGYGVLGASRGKPQSAL